ncbi:hypothetical protein [Mucilaginibacter sp.]|uniref:hypothetical protein n=1 Tax=Mucilaginibacter sp. TaxID=1882438 RepID=UPI0028438163|nr:hypothetical protein [Mucilaginibacter sp.]MDR3693036.1 hypothetical protein [Mucilaginibacter sp.]
MVSFNQIGPWITAIVLFAVVIFFCVFYIVKLVQARRTVVSIDSKPSDNLKDRKRKLKDEIIHDIVADITPVLEKRLEKAL